MNKPLAILFMAPLLPLLALSCNAAPPSQEGAAMRQEMLSDENLERMEARMEQMLDRIREMRATGNMEERRRLMEEYRQEMLHEKMRKQDGMMCPMMEPSYRGGRDGSIER